MEFIGIGYLLTFVSNFIRERKFSARECDYEKEKNARNKKEEI